MSLATPHDAEEPIWQALIARMTSAEKAFRERSRFGSSPERRSFSSAGRNSSVRSSGSSSSAQHGSKS